MKTKIEGQEVECTPLEYLELLRALQGQKQESKETYFRAPVSKEKRGRKKKTRKEYAEIVEQMHPYIKKGLSMTAACKKVLGHYDFRILEAYRKFLKKNRMTLKVKNSKTASAAEWIGRKQKEGIPFRAARKKACEAWKANKGNGIQSDWLFFADAQKERAWEMLLKDYAKGYQCKKADMGLVGIDLETWERLLTKTILINQVITNRLGISGKFSIAKDEENFPVLRYA
jgi:hypothetical protein